MASAAKQALRLIEAECALLAPVDHFGLLVDIAANVGFGIGWFGNFLESRFAGRVGGEFFGRVVVGKLADGG